MDKTGKETNNWIAASNACAFISLSKPKGRGKCHDCPHIPFSAAGFNGDRGAACNETS